MKFLSYPWQLVTIKGCNYSKKSWPFQLITDLITAETKLNGSMLMIPFKYIIWQSLNVTVLCNDGEESQQSTLPKHVCFFYLCCCVVIAALPTI